MTPADIADPRDEVLQQDLPRSAVEDLREAFGAKLHAVVLFGSLARGDYHDESDWDVLVIADGLPDNVFDRGRCVRRALRSPGTGAFTVISKTRDEYEGDLSSLDLDIGLDGRVLFERGDYATSRLHRIREILDRVGLYRVRTPSGDMWKWREPPKGKWVVNWNS